MLGDLRASLYDVLGYLFPGAAFGAGVWVLLHAVFGDGPLYLSLPNDTLTATFLAGLAYVLGHVPQALGNLLFRRAPELHLLAPGRFPTGLLELAASRLRTLIGGPVGLELSSKSLFALADEYRMAAGCAGDREIYVYREGFYRGMAFGMMMLGIGILAHLPTDRCLQLGSGPIRCHDVAELLTAGAVCMMFAAAFLARMRRFGRYRVERAIYGLLASAPEKA